MKQVFLIVGILISVTCFGQVDADCDSVYIFAEKMPEFKNGDSGLSGYLHSDLIPILANCIERDSSLIASMYLTLTINKHGKVIDVIFNRISASDQCKNDLRQKILTMPSWTAGVDKGKRVCCRYSWPISCIMWQ
ncbi:hypothetical protein [uncultured Draconibacterium sp.]|uniref:hypothetical protein n=1 Tax=uncultured Draconibacterium sp. TaxID=1573823 RepID=UPI003261C2F9